jgi:hypothetical protein
VDVAIWHCGNLYQGLVIIILIGAIRAIIEFKIMHGFDR